MQLWRPTRWRQKDPVQPLRAGHSDCLRVALQKALLGQITPTMRLISVEAEDDLIRVIVFFDQRLDDHDRDDFEEELASCLGASLGDPPLGPSVVSHFIRCDEPQLIPVRGEIIFSRKGVRAF